MIYRKHRSTFLTYSYFKQARFCVRKKNQEISVFPEMAEQKHGVSGMISHIAWVSLLKLNFLLIFCISPIKSMENRMY